MFALAAIRSAPPERVERYTPYLKALVPASIMTMNRSFAGTLSTAVIAV
jgi:hypothetical protein